MSPSSADRVNTSDSVLKPKADSSGQNQSPIDTPAASGGSAYLWVPDGVATVPLRLITPRLLSSALAIAGIQWKVAARKDSVLAKTEPGLYAWVDGRSDQADPLKAGILYIGIGESSKGVLDRIDYEDNVRTGDHAHGLAISRRNAIAVVGSVESDLVAPDFVRNYVHSYDDLNERAIGHFDQWWESAQVDLQRAVERVAIRLSVHLGDTVSPVNSQFAGAWNQDASDADWVAFSIARWMEREAVGAPR